MTICLSRKCLPWSFVALLHFITLASVQHESFGSVFHLSFGLITFGGSSDHVSILPCAQKWPSHINMSLIILMVYNHFCHYEEVKEGAVSSWWTANTIPCSSQNYFFCVRKQLHGDWYILITLSGKLRM